MKKPKMSKLFVMKVPQELFEKFQTKCVENYKTMSDVVRDKMIEYIKEIK